MADDLRCPTCKEKCRWSLNCRGCGYCRYLRYKDKLEWAESCVEFWQEKLEPAIEDLKHVEEQIEAWSKKVKYYRKVMPTTDDNA